MSPKNAIGATEFKAMCLELMSEVHDRKRDSVIITKRGKAFAKLVRVEEQRKPFYGCMKGLAKAQGDLTEPTSGGWEALKD